MRRITIALGVSAVVSTGVVAVGRSVAWLDRRRQAADERDERRELRRREAESAFLQATVGSMVSATETVANNTVMAIQTAVEAVTSTVLDAVLGKRGEDGRIEQVETTATMDAGAAEWVEAPEWTTRDWTDDLLPDDQRPDMASLGVGESLIPGVPRPDMSGEEAQL